MLNKTIYIYTHTIEKYKRKMCYTQKNNSLQNIYDKLWKEKNGNQPYSWI